MCLISDFLPRWSSTLSYKDFVIYIALNFKIVYDVCTLAGFTIVYVQEYCAVFVRSFVVFDSSENMSWCLSHVKDVLIFRTSIFVNDMRIESFRAFAFVVKIVWYFSADVCGFNFYIVLFKNRFYMFWNFSEGLLR